MTITKILITEEARMRIHYLNKFQWQVALNPTTIRVSTNPTEMAVQDNMATITTRGIQVVAQGSKSHIKVQTTKKTKVGTMAQSITHTAVDNAPNNSINLPMAEQMVQKLNKGNQEL